VFRRSVPEIRKLLAEGKRVHLHLIGRRAAQFFGRLKDAGIKIDYVHPDIVEKITFRRVKSIMGDLVKAYLDDRIQEVRIVYTALVGAATCKPTLQTVIPFQKPENKAGENADAGEYILEPSPAAIVERLVPRFLEMQLFAAILESLAAEFASRRIAMKNATDNADEVIQTLIKEYNKARQAGITSELLEITSGAEAARAS
jgi:F-type H+-transporting ATPase subunit gamma